MLKDLTWPFLEWYQIPSTHQVSLLGCPALHLSMIACNLEWLSKGLVGHTFWGGGLGGGLGGVRSIRVHKLVSPAKVERLMSHWFVALASVALDCRPFCSRAVCHGSLLCLYLADQTRS